MGGRWITPGFDRTLTSVKLRNASFWSSKRTPLIQCFTLSMQQASTTRGSGWERKITKSLWLSSKSDPVTRVAKECVDKRMRTVYSITTIGANLKTLSRDIFDTTWMQPWHLRQLWGSFVTILGQFWDGFEARWIVSFPLRDDATLWQLYIWWPGEDRFITL